MATEVFASYDNDGTLNEETLRANLKRAGGTTADGGDLEKEEPGGFPIKVKMDGYIFEIDKYGNITKEGEIASGGGEQGDEPPVEGTIPEDTSYVGYYADLDGDEQADGIIYADLAVGHEQETQWNNDDGKYKYSKETEKLKQYTKEDENYTSDKFGDYEAPLVKLAESSSEGKDRFYVMDLEDYDESTHTWYASVYGNDYNGLPDDKVVDSNVSDFKDDSGKENTKYWIEINNDTDFQKTYGLLDNNDIWKILNGNLNKKNKDWFVPSRAEWSAFADMCVNKVLVNFGRSGNYNTKFGLSNYYWSSSFVRYCPRMGH